MKLAWIKTGKNNVNTNTDGTRILYTLGPYATTKIQNFKVHYRKSLILKLIPGRERN